MALTEGRNATLTATPSAEGRCRTTPPSVTSGQGATFACIGATCVGTYGAATAPSIMRLVGIDRAKASGPGTLPGTGS